MAEQKLDLEASVAGIIDHPVHLYILKLDVQSAKDIPAADITGTSDPYVIVKIADSTWETSTIEKTLNPTWNESKIFTFFSPPESIQFTIMDRDKHMKNDLIAESELDLATAFESIYMKASSTKKLKLEEKRHLQGTHEAELQLFKSKKKKKKIQKKAVEGTLIVAVSLQILLPLDTEMKLSEILKQYEVVTQEKTNLEGRVQQLNKEMTDVKKELSDERLNSEQMKNEYDLKVAGMQKELEDERKSKAEVEADRRGLEAEVQRLKKGKRHTKVVVDETSPLITKDSSQRAKDSDEGRCCPCCVVL